MAFKHQWDEVQNFVLQAFKGELSKEFTFKGYVHSSPWHRGNRMQEEFGKVSVLLSIRNGKATMNYMDEKIHDYHETGSVSFSKGQIIVGMSIGFRYRATARRLKLYTNSDLPPASTELTVEKVGFARHLRMEGDEVAYQFVDKLGK